MGSVIVDQDFPYDIVRRGARDARRHNTRVLDAARKQLKNIITNQDIVTSEGNKRVKVRLKDLDSFIFRHYPDRVDNVGRDEFDDLEDGEIISKPEPGIGVGNKPGNDAGEEVYEVEFTIDDLTDMMMEQLQLPDLDDTLKNEIVSERTEWTDRRKGSGIQSLIDRKQTLKANIMRKAKLGVPREKRLPIINDDLRFRTWETHQEKHSNAVVFLQMDRSGSMSDDKIYAVKALYFWMVRFLKRKYDRVDIRFIGHDYTAKELTEKEFFSIASGGGTAVSSAYTLVRDMVKHNYSSSAWNIYCFHASDGDTFGDEKHCVDIVQELLRLGTKLFAYAEIKIDGYQDGDSELYTLLTELFLQGMPVATASIDELDDIMGTIKRFCSRDNESKVGR